jgi:AAA ATPase domain
MTDSPGTLQDVLDEHAAALVGREREREALFGILGERGPLFAFVHGVGGIGKSRLVRAFARDARARGARVVLLDCATVEPTERAFRTAVGDVTAGDGPFVLVLDSYEKFTLLDSWLRLEFVGTLSAGARVVLAGRDGPGAWRQSFGELVLSIRLDGLRPPDATALLEAAGVEGPIAVRVNRLAQGHPLALQLAAAALAERERVPEADAALRPVVEVVTELYLDGLDARDTPRPRRRGGRAARHAVGAPGDAARPGAPRRL